MRPEQPSKSKSKSNAPQRLLIHNQQYFLHGVLVVTVVIVLVEFFVQQQQRQVFAFVPLSLLPASILTRSRHRILPVVPTIRLTFNPYRRRKGISRLFLVVNPSYSNSSDNESTKSITSTTGSTSSVKATTAATTTATTTITTSSLSSVQESACPYSMKFTPYKIDLTTTTTSSTDLLSSSYNKPKKNIFQSFLDDATKSVLSISKNQQENQIINDIENTAESCGNNIQIEWITQQQDTLQCYSTLWTILSKLLLQQQHQSNDSTDSTKTTTGATSTRTTNVFCFPDANKMVLLNWYEIVSWMNHHIEQDYKSTNRSNNSSNPLIEVFYKDTYSIPRIEVRLRNNMNTDNNDKMIATANNNNNIQQQYYYDHAIVTKQTQNWVQRLLVNYGICPFTKSSKRSGQGLADVNVPVGKISYHTSQSQPPPLFLNKIDKDIDDSSTNAKLEQEQEQKDNLLLAWTQLQADTWDAIVNMFITVGVNGVDGISSILLSSPGYNNNFVMWSGPIFTLLEAGVVASQSLDTVGIVCFHPLYSTPDGTTWPGFGQMHSIPRLSKWYNDTIIDQQRSEQKLIEKNLRIQNQQQKQQIYNNTIVEVSESITTATGQEQDQEQNDQKQEQFLSLNDIAAGGAWQRRTPHATINILRANQLAAAETKRITSTLYTNNIQKLILDIGCTQLQQELINDITNC